MGSAPLQISGAILAVDDDPLVLEMLRDTLEMQGLKTLAAANGTEAIRLAQLSGEKIALLITDVLMPEMNGLELAEHFQRHSPGTKVLFMSGYICPGAAHQDIPMSEKAFLLKPFTSKSLIAKMRKILA